MFYNNADSSSRSADIFGFEFKGKSFKEIASRMNMRQVLSIVSFIWKQSSGTY